MLQNIPKNGKPNCLSKFSDHDPSLNTVLYLTKLVDLKYGVLNVEYFVDFLCREGFSCYIIEK